MAVGGALAAIGGEITNSARPSKGPFNPWTYPAMLIAYFGLLVVVVGLVGLIREREFPLAKNRETAKVAERKSAPWASVLDPLTPYESPIQVPTVESPLTIIMALYGVGNQWREVTETVEARVRNGHLDVLVGNEPFDPLDAIAPNKGKYLKIHYCLNGGDVLTDEWAEGQRAILPK